MNKQVILLRDSETECVSEVKKSINGAGISVLLHELTTSESAPAKPVEIPADSRVLAVLYEICEGATLSRLRSIVDRTSVLFPELPILGYRQQLTKTGVNSIDDPTLQRIGFRAIAASPAQLPALLRQVEEVVGTGELRLPEGFKSPPESNAFSLPPSIRRQHLRGAFALLASLHLAANQKEAALAAIAGVARLAPADRWSIFLSLQERSTEAGRLELLAARRFSNGKALQFDEQWQRELIDDSESPGVAESRSAKEAAAGLEPVKRTEKKNRIIALPLVSGERLIGVLEGLRGGDGARGFSGSETLLLSALTLPIASALSNSVRIAEAERLSLTDELTRLHNARYLRQFLVNEIKRARRYRSNLAALFLDLDDFKRINDLHGHLAGSHALMEVASIVLPSVRDTDCVVRYGGDEFVVILPETGVEEAAQVAERIRAKIECHQFSGGRRLKISLTVSTGIAVFPQHAMSPQQLIAYADRAMYQAKAAHKNCVRVASDTEGSSLADAPPASGPVHPTQFQRIPDEKLIS
jgi:diguanylate cyclase (GGDEF)-like protein